MTRITESENPFTSEIDQLETEEMLRLINTEDKSVPAVVGGQIESIARVVDGVYGKLANGGRLFYVGTGTSGRLGVLDAAELPPTFGISPELVTGVIAGGYSALFKASEASEDSEEAGRTDLEKQGVTKNDCVIGIAASGSTPYTIGAVRYGRELGSFTACITCNPASPIESEVDEAIVTIVGPEVITGSTRMKAGTAQKLVLNMISTAVMIRMGYVRGNKMVNVRAANLKLVERSINLLVRETGLDQERAFTLFEESGRDLKTALVMSETGATRDAAASALESNTFSIRGAIASLDRER